MGQSASLIGDRLHFYLVFGIVSRDDVDATYNGLYVGRFKSTIRRFCVSFISEERVYKSLYQASNQ